MSMSVVINTEANRKSIKYTQKEQLKRIVWMLVKPLFRFSPRPLFGWRNFLLRQLGAKIGEGVHVYNNAVIYFPWNLTMEDYSTIGEGALIYNLGPVYIGKNATISQRAHICAGTHDYTRTDMLLEKPPIVIESQVWVCADAFVGPNVVVHEGAVVAARAVIVKDVEPWAIMGGNPAKFIKKRVIVS